MNPHLRNKSQLVLCLFFLLTRDFASGENILMFAIFGSQSYSIVFHEVAKALVATGRHQVTIVTAYPPKGAGSNIEEIFIPHVMEIDHRYVFEHEPEGRSFYHQTITAFGMFLRFAPRCKMVFDNPRFQDVVKRARVKPFDLVINNAILNECMFPVGAVLGRHVVAINSGDRFFNTITAPLNIPMPYSYVPNLMTTFGDRMNFLERVANVMIHTVFKILDDTVMPYSVNAVVRESFPDAPSLAEAFEQIAMVLVNKNKATGMSTPNMEYVQNIGPLHCRPSKPLPKDLEEFMAGSGEAGVILVSLGTIVPEQDMPEQTKSTFIEALSRIPQRVVWKFGSSNHSLPPNIIMRDWVPQQDILGHPKIRGFISHGGHMSLEESVYHGVPVLGMPVFFDQPGNVARMVRQGYGVELRWVDLTVEALLDRLDSIVNDTRFKSEAVRRASIMKDHQLPPTQQAVYWLEYILRHNGTRHLRSGGEDLNIFQYFLVDVIGLFAVIAAVYCYVMYRLLKWACCGKRQKAGTQKKMKKK